jgi:hypothetical protein
MGGATVTGSLLVLGGAGQYVALPTSGLGSATGFTLLIVYKVTSVGAQQVLASFGDPNGGGLELGVNVAGFPYVANRGELFTAATAVVVGVRSTIAVVCATMRIYCFLV